jgi:hypothetical protein
MPPPSGCAACLFPAQFHAPLFTPSVTIQPSDPWATEIEVDLHFFDLPYVSLQQLIACAHAVSALGVRGGIISQLISSSG